MLYIFFKNIYTLESEYHNTLFSKYTNRFVEKSTKQIFKYTLRSKLSKIKSIDDCIRLLQMFETTDEMCENIVNIFHKFHPSENELQKFSLIFQKYHNHIDNKGFAASTLWFCIIQWINEFQKLKNKNDNIVNVNSVGIELLNLNLDLN
tara:strand:+ start:348 stop:794 length:447 start_codon:yes stop_codon:yes gene_type:complete